MHRSKYFIFAALIVLLVALLLLWTRLGSSSHDPVVNDEIQQENKVTNGENEDISTRDSGARTAFERKGVDQQEIVEVWGNFEADFWRKLEDGYKDEGSIYEAFALFLDSRFPYERIIEISASLLNHNNITVRLLSCRNLYLFSNGDKALPVLQNILSNSEFSIKSKEQALGVLVEFREDRAREQILEFYRTYSNPKVLFAPLSQLGVKEILDDVLDARNETGASYALILSRLAPSQNIQILTDVYAKSDHVSVKQALARTLFNETGNAEFYDYLKEYAKVAVQDYPNSERKRSSRSFSDENISAFKHLAAMDELKAKRYVEESLSSNNPVVVEVALANLLYGDKSSPVALERLREEVANRQSLISEETKLRLAFYSGDRTTMDLVRQTYDKNYKGPSNYWWRYSRHHKYQSIHYWGKGLIIDL